MTTDFGWIQLPTLKLGTPQQVAGESHYQDALDWVAGGRNGSGTAIRLFTATLVKEPENPHDSRAIRVCAGEHTIGHVPKENIERFSPVIDRLGRDGQKTTCRAELTGGWDRGNGDRGTIGVHLHTGPKPTVWSDKVAFLPRGPWHDDVPVVPLAGLSADAQPGDKSVVTLVSAHGAIAVRHAATWVGHIINRPDLVANVDRIASVGLPTTAELRVHDGKPVIPLVDPDLLGQLMHALGPVGLRVVRRTTRPTGRWVCTRCHRVWVDLREPPARWYELAVDEDQSPHVCPSCWSYAFTHPY